MIDITDIKKFSSYAVGIIVGLHMWERPVTVDDILDNARYIESHWNDIAATGCKFNMKDCIDGMNDAVNLFLIDDLKPDVLKR